MKFSTTAFLTALAASTTSAAKDERTFAVLRFNGKELTKGRMDPIVNPGGPSKHVHTIMGGSGFSWDATGDDLMNSECSNAKVKGDNSNYWFPSLYFHDQKNDTFEPVEVFYVNAYYFFEATNDDIKAFPVGLQMVSGDALKRTPPQTGGRTNLDPSEGEVNPVKFTCPRANFDPPSWPSGSDGLLAGIQDPNNKGEGVGFPECDCDGYASPLRADIHFPSCYNPEAGLTAHSDNMAFPSNNNGKNDCPEGWIHVPHLFLEVYWNTPKFNDRWDQFSGSQPFVLSNGDATGYGSHADFMSGWDEELLQHIIDTCDAGTSGMDTCPGLFYGLNEGECTIPSQVDEQIDGVLDALPGSNPLQGWAFGLDGSVPPSSTPSGTPSGTPSSSASASASSAGSSSRASSAAASSASTQSSEESAPTSLPASGDAPTNVVENPTVPTSTVAAQEPIDLTASSRRPTKTKTCSPRTKTVYETVTVTDESLTPTAAADPYAKAKRDHIRRHHHHHV
jgi:hypothetical protein